VLNEAARERGFDAPVSWTFVRLKGWDAELLSPGPRPLARGAHLLSVVVSSRADIPYAPPQPAMRRIGMQPRMPQQGNRNLRRWNGKGEGVHAVAEVPRMSFGNAGDEVGGPSQGERSRKAADEYSANAASSAIPRKALSCLAWCVLKAKRRAALGRKASSHAVPVQRVRVPSR